MSSLLDRAKRVFDRSSNDPVASTKFAITCRCGRRVAGLRPDTRHFFKCKGCGRILFVMPESPYPVPLPPVPKKKPVAEPEHVEPGNAASPKSPSVANPQPSPEASSSSAATAAELPASDARESTPGKRMVELPAKAPFWTRGKLVMSGLFTLVTFTIVATIYMSDRDRLSSELRAAESAWKEAIEAGDFTAAREELEAAAVLVNRHGGGSAESKRIVNLAREIAVYDDRVISIENLIGKLAVMTPSERVGFLGDDGGNAIILDLTLSSDEDEPNPMLFVENRLVELNVKSIGIVSELTEFVGKRVILGVRMKDFVDLDSRYVLEFNRESGVVMTSPECLEKAGWVNDENFQDTLAGQLQWIVSDQ